MKINKSENNKFVMKAAENYAISVTKKEMDNLVMPMLSEMSEMLFDLWQLVICTKEQPDGCFYDKNQYQLVIRIIAGQVLFGGRIDAYAWKHTKVEAACSRPCGLESSEAKANLEDFLQTINDDGEREMMRKFITLFRHNFLIVHTDEEERVAMEVTQKLYDAGLTSVVDSWMEPDDDGNAEETVLEVGDWLVINKEKGTAYCIRHKEFLMTHRIG